MDHVHESVAVDNDLTRTESFFLPPSIFFFLSLGNRPDLCSPVSPEDSLELQGFAISRHNDDMAMDNVETKIKLLEKLKKIFQTYCNILIWQCIILHLSFIDSIYLSLLIV